MIGRILDRILDLTDAIDHRRPLWTDRSREAYIAEWLAGGGRRLGDRAVWKPDQLSRSGGTTVYDAPERAASCIDGEIWRVRAEGLDVHSFGCSLPHYGHARAIEFVEPLPSWRRFGPRGEKIERLIERLRRLTDEEAHEVARTFGSAGAAPPVGSLSAIQDVRANCAAKAVRDAGERAAWDVPDAGEWDYRCVWVFFLSSTWGAACQILATAAAGYARDQLGMDDPRLAPLRPFW